MLALNVVKMIDEIVKELAFHHLVSQSELKSAQACKNAHDLQSLVALV